MYARITNAKKLACEGKVYVEEHAQEEAIYQGEHCMHGEGCVQGDGLCTRV